MSRVCLDSVFVQRVARVTASRRTASRFRVFNFPCVVFLFLKFVTLSKWEKKNKKKAISTENKMATGGFAHSVNILTSFFLFF